MNATKSVFPVPVQGNWSEVIGSTLGGFRACADGPHTCTWVIDLVTTKERLDAYHAFGRKEGKGRLYKSMLPGDRPLTETMVRRLLNPDMTRIYVIMDGSRIIAALELQLRNEGRGFVVAYVENVLTAGAFEGRGLSRYLISFAMSEAKNDPDVREIRLNFDGTSKKLRSFYGSFRFEVDEYDRNGRLKLY